MRGGGLGLLLSFYLWPLEMLAIKHQPLGRDVIQFKLTVPIDYEASIEGPRI
jgi:hypothetical protein